MRKEHGPNLNRNTNTNAKAGTRTDTGFHTHDHSAILERVSREFPADELLCDLSDLFKLFGDSTRTRILYALMNQEICVCALADLLGMTQSAISHQLKVLKDGNLVRTRREGKTIYYSLADEHVHHLISCGFEHLMEDHMAHIQDDEINK